MSGKQPVEVLLRPAVELYTVAACRRRVSVPGGPMVARAEPAMGVGSAWRSVPTARSATAMPRHPALPAQHPPPAAVRDDEQGCAGQPAAAVRGARVPLGAEAHP